MRSATSSTPASRRSWTIDPGRLRRTSRLLKKVQMRGGEGGGTPRRSAYSALASWLRPSARMATYVERVPPPAPHSRRWAFFSRLLRLGEGDEERAELDGLEASGDLAVLPCPRDLGE